MKTVLVVVAHSDDEAIGCAGTIAKHVAQGDKVHILYMTDGVSSRGENEDKRDLLAQKASSMLGISLIKQYNFPDNSMDTIPLLEVTKVIESAIEKVSPSVVYTHHIGDLNVDHQITHKATITACRPQPESSVKEIYCFEVLSSSEWQTSGVLPFTPNLFVDITSYIHTKQMVLNIYQSEMRSAPHSRNIDNIIRLSALRGCSVGVNYAEAFMVIRLVK